MQTLPEVHEDLSESLTGDLDRDLSEYGLSYEELGVCGQIAVTRLAAALDDGPMDLEVALRTVFAEGVLLGIAWHRERAR